VGAIGFIAVGVAVVVYLITWFRRRLRRRHPSGKEGEAP
jgi:hypothetical protein